MRGLFSTNLSLTRCEDCIEPTASLRQDTSQMDALQFFLDWRITKVAVVSEQGHLMGVLESTTLLEALAKKTFEPAGAIQQWVQQADYFVFEEKGWIQDLEQLIQRGWYGVNYVIDREGRLLGQLQTAQFSKFIQSTLEDTDRFVSQIFHAIHDGIVAIDKEGKIILLNPAGERTLEFKEQEALGQPIKKFLPESMTQQALESGQALRQVRMTFGEVNTMADFLPIYSSENQLLGAFGILSDITQLEEMTHRLTTNEKLMATLETVVENTYEGIILIDDQERILLMNQFFLEVMGMDAQDVIGKEIRKLIPDSKLPETLVSGQAQFGETWQLGEREFVIMRVPIVKEGKVVGAIAKTLFHNMEIAKVFAKKAMRLEEDLAYYKEEFGKMNAPRFAFDDIIGQSPPMEKAKSLVDRAARTESTILLLGESGTGKEVFAHAIHKASVRSKGPFIKVNCAALPDNLLESELFGYAEGAFTGARKGGKPGKFELANKGTILLDEIGDMNLMMQAKLLRVLQEREIERLGGTDSIKLDVRIIASTNRELHQMVMEQKFRLDLYYRLNVLSIELPPLRRRKEDIFPLSKALVKKLNKRIGSSIKGVTQETLAILSSYDWPGNIRELENILERAMVICDEEWIQPKHLSLPGLHPSTSLLGKSLEQTLAEVERDVIIEAIKSVHGNKVHAARILGIHRSVLYKKMTKYQIEE